MLGPAGQPHARRHRRRLATACHGAGLAHAGAGAVRRCHGPRRTGLVLSGGNAAHRARRAGRLLPGLGHADDAARQRLRAGLHAALLRFHAPPRSALRAAEPDLAVLRAGLHGAARAGLPARMGDRGTRRLAARDLGLHEPESAIRRLQLPGLDAPGPDLSGGGLHDPVRAFGFLGPGAVRALAAGQHRLRARPGVPSAGGELRS